MQPGNMTEFKLGIPAGDTEMGWFKKYGDVFKFHACFGVCFPFAGDGHYA